MPKQKSAPETETPNGVRTTVSHGEAPPKKPPASVLVIDVGGSKAKMLVSGETEPRRGRTGKDFTPTKLVELVQKLAEGWKFEALTIGLPGPVGHHGPQTEPGNLGAGWVGFDFANAFGLPVKVVNDAVLQALGSYEHGRMVFIGLGTGVGSALIADNIIVPMEIGHLPFDGKRTVNDMLCRQGLKRYGKSAWRKGIKRLVPILMRTFIADYVVLGGGNAKNVKDVPAGARLGHNLTAFRGGFRVWEPDSHWTLAIPDGKATT